MQLPVGSCCRTWRPAAMSHHTIPRGICFGISTYFYPAEKIHEKIPEKVFLNHHRGSLGYPWLTHWIPQVPGPTCPAGTWNSCAARASRGPGPFTDFDVMNPTMFPVKNHETSAWLGAAEKLRVTPKMFSGLESIKISSSPKKVAMWEAYCIPHTFHYIPIFRYMAISWLANRLATSK